MSSTVDVENPTSDIPGAGTPSRGGGLVLTVARGIGQTLITVGLVALLFVVYQLYVTDLLAARAQGHLSQQIQDRWADSPTVEVPTSPPSGGASAAAPAPGAIDVGLGEPFAILHIPRLGADYSRVIVEGTAQVQLAQGPGHYLDTAMPGQDGNFAVAGHRVGRGSPFLDLDTLMPGDPIVVETADSWFVYRVLGDPATGSFDGDPSGIPGQEIVRPEDVDVISPTPRTAVDAPATGAFLTLTTCHPKYSARQRLIIHARLDGTWLSKTVAPDGPPALAG